MNTITDILFDLDKTLWDFDSNSAETFFEICKLLKLNKSGINDFEKFYHDYEKHNLALWDLYRQNKISKQDLMVRRFYNAFNDYGIDDFSLAVAFSEKYLEILPTKTKLMPYAKETLEYLKNKYRLHIATNGFEEVQFQKLENSGIKIFFDNIITSEMVGCKKPDVCFYEFALKILNRDADTCVMIGDDAETDLHGAQRAGLKQVYYNPDKKTQFSGFTYEITSLKELINIL